MLISAQYDPGTAALLGNVVGNLSNTIMAGTNLSVCFGATVMRAVCSALGELNPAEVQSAQVFSSPCALPSAFLSE